MKNLKKILSALLCAMLVVSCFSLTSCDILNSLLSGNTPGGNTPGGGATDGDWFDDDIFDDFDDDDNTNGDVTDTPNDDNNDDENPTMQGPGAVRFEAEYAEWQPAAGQEDFRIESPGHASNGQCVAYFRTGGKLIFKVYSDKAEAGVQVTISAASAVEKVVDGQQAGLKPVTAEDLAGAVTCNGVASTITGQFDGSDTMAWHNFTTISATVDLVEGWNEFVFTCTATNGDSFSGLNVDYVELTTTEAKLGWWPLY